MRYASSAKDQKHPQYVTIREYPQPFATASMARYIYKEIKLLKFLRHENVRPLRITPIIVFVLTEQLANLVNISVAPMGYLCAPFLATVSIQFSDVSRYITTEVMELDLEVLLRTRPIQEEFVQFFLYQIMVWSLNRHSDYVLMS